MFNTSIVEVAVGLIFVFSMLAILVTQINTLITTALNLRAKQLKAGISELVTDPQVRAKLLAHPTINLVNANVPTRAQLTEEDAENIAAIEETEIDYIPPKTFVEALMGILIADSEKYLFSPLRNVVNDMPNSLEKSQLRELVRSLNIGFSEDTVRRIYQIINTITDEGPRNQLVQALNEVEESIEELKFKNPQLIPLLDGISKIDDGKFQSALQTVLVSAQNLEEAEEKLEAWFNTGMNRVSSVFKKQIQLYSMVVAFVLAVVLNVDTLYLARSLWDNPELRQTVVAAANELDQSSFTGETATTITEDEVDTAALEAQAREANSTLQRLLELQLPIGWQYTTVNQSMVDASAAAGLADPRRNARNVWNYVPGNGEGWLSLLLQKIIGLALTTVAAAQGAPFWFDLLNKLTQRRD